jgi:hypothetical protein
MLVFYLDQLNLGAHEFVSTISAALVSLYEENSVPSSAVE